MNCERFQTVINELARESMMEAADRATALEHAAQCQSCAVSLEDERDLTAGLRTLAQEMNSLSAPPELEGKLLLAFRERKSSPVVVPLPVRRSKALYWAAAIAAMLLIVFGIFALKGGLPGQPSQQVVIPSPKPVETPGGREVNKQPETPKNQESIRVVDNKGGSPAPAPRRIGKGVGNRKPTIGNSNEAVAMTTGQQNVEVVTDFFPIGYMNAASFQEGGQLLRLELPRSAVARFGLPVNMDRPGDRVKADVLVGADGLAQAIRFVQ